MSAKPSSYAMHLLHVLYALFTTSLQRLMSSHTIEDLTSCILDFQANMVRVTFRKKTTLVEPDFEPLHSAALQFVWDHSRLEEEREDAVTTIKWRKLGFETEDIGHEFREVGVLGLDCLVRVHDLYDCFETVTL